MTVHFLGTPFELQFSNGTLTPNYCVIPFCLGSISLAPGDLTIAGAESPTSGLNLNLTWTCAACRFPIGVSLVPQAYDSSLDELLWRTYFILSGLTAKGPNRPTPVMPFTEDELLTKLTKWYNDPQRKSETDSFSPAQPDEHPSRLFYEIARRSLDPDLARTLRADHPTASIKKIVRLCANFAKTK